MATNGNETDLLREGPKYVPRQPSIICPQGLEEMRCSSTLVG
jgi:hypothetical protein